MAKENKDFLEDTQGRLVPVSAIKPIDLKRHEAVTSIMADTFSDGMVRASVCARYVCVCDVRVCRGGAMECAM